MPSRKGESSETQPDSRRSSLRRLSSIASFQTLFTRRRSNNAAEHTATSSTSTLSLSSSTVANAPEPFSLLGSSTSSTYHEDTLTELPEPPTETHFPARRSSYICLPDDPIGGMPRSRTFSNLPLPTRAKRTSSMVPSKSHTRLPSALLPFTRLPSPPISNRKHSHSRLTSVEMKKPMARSRMMRSDTEPLLKTSMEQASHLPRSTAFKENISLSPIKPLPEMDLFNSDGSYSSYHSSLPSSSYGGMQSWDQAIDENAPLLGRSFPSSPPELRYARHTAARMSREYKSSPAYRSSKERQATPIASKGPEVQRWSSQPALTNATNVRRHSQQAPTKQTRLMSARQAPTPPPPKTPLTSQPQASSKLKSSNNSGHIREVSEQTPLQSRSDAKARSPSPKKPTTRSPLPPKKSIHQITHPEPPSYWCGRLCALADRYRNEELATQLSALHNASKSQTDKMHTPEATTARLRRALEYLDEMCVTAEAKESLAVFRQQYAATTGLAELSRPIVLNGPVSAEAGGGDGDGGGGSGGGLAQSASEARKISFMDRLLGRQGKRRSLALA